VTSPEEEQERMGSTDDEKEEHEDHDEKDEEADDKASCYSGSDAISGNNFQSGDEDEMEEVDLYEDERGEYEGLVQFY